ncbi:hypothetical protein C2G38_2174373 [Gigaspora rosea]|uniref:Uncharacterized protein n=1 Tax=Gigaspora rosea TaxID=44941 RepID=A0A397VQR2_9GLOM|nr:hypothetical protein C2G38_2174373 [Gigaspora rosea]
MDPQNRIQYTNLPWVLSSFSRHQYEDLFEITSEMQEAIDQELNNYLAEILELLCKEKSSTTNAIDSLVANIGSSSRCDKRCLNCGEQSIDNRKQLCPKCKTRLPTLAELPRQEVPELKKRVNVPEIFIPDPLNVNPNSTANIEKRISKIKNNYPWLVLIPGQLHEEMNMLRADVDLKQFVIYQGYKTENQLAYFKKCYDHHKSWDSVCNIYLQAMAMELMWPYFENCSNPSVEGYLAWRAAKRVFSPVWSARRHPIYRLIDASDEVQLMQLDPTIRDIVDKYSVVSRSGLFNQHQGLDAILEEFNKVLKSLIPPIPQERHWKVTARNFAKQFFRSIGYNDSQTTGPRTRPESISECQRFRIRPRKDNFVSPLESRTICKNLGGQELSSKLTEFMTLAKQARKEYVTKVFCDNSSDSFCRPIPITKQEETAQIEESNMTRPEIIRKIEAFLEQMNKSIQKQYCGFKRKRLNELFIVLEEVRSLFNSENEHNNVDYAENSESVGDNVTREE